MGLCGLSLNDLIRNTLKINNSGADFAEKNAK